MFNPLSWLRNEVICLPFPTTVVPRVTWEGQEIATQVVPKVRFTNGRFYVDNAKHDICWVASVQALGFQTFLVDSTLQAYLNAMSSIHRGLVNLFPPKTCRLWQFLSY